MYYRYTQKWVDIFHEEPDMIQVETGLYIRGMHNLISAHFDLSNYEKFDKTLGHEKQSNSIAGLFSSSQSV